MKIGVISKIIVLFFLVLSLLLSLISVLGLTYISKNTGTPLLYFPKTILNSFHHPSLSGNFTFLILGLDPRQDSLENTVTTDTIIIGSLTNTGVNLISIPRDLWNYSLSSKVNQIYPLSLNTSDKFDFIQDRFSELAGIKISRTFVINTTTLEKLTELVGGVDVYLNEGFTDNQYPNPDYIKNPSPAIPLYTTVSFPQGTNYINSGNVAPFVRSRKSAVGGTDLGRIQRQQLLINALLNKIRSPQILFNRHLVFSLYKFFKSDIETNFSDHDIFSLIYNISPNYNNLVLKTHSIPIGDQNRKDIIYHPDRFSSPQWVFIPMDPDYKQFQQYIISHLNN